MLADSSGRTKHRSACHPRSDICFIPAAIPARIFSASSPDGNEGSEKSTVSGSWPTNNTRFILKPSIGHSAYYAPSNAIYLLVLTLKLSGALLLRVPPRTHCWPLCQDRWLLEVRGGFTCRGAARPRR